MDRVLGSGPVVGSGRVWGHDKLSDRLKLIKHQRKIVQAKDDNDVVDQALGSEVHSSQRTKKTSN